MNVTTLMIIHAVISVLLIAIVLLQFGKGAEAGLFTGGASEAVFSSNQKGNILSKITTFLTVLFLGNCILMAKMQSTNSTKSIMDSEVSAPVFNRDAEVEKQEKALEAKGLSKETSSEAPKK